MTTVSHSTKVNSTSPVNLEVEMDHYSLELLGKLHHKELMREGVCSQAVSRSGPGNYLSKHWKRILFVVAVIILMYFHFFV
jgi:hypothetical protein